MLQDLQIFNAEDLKYNSFACYMTRDGSQFKEMDFAYDGTTYTLTLKPQEAGTKIEDILNVYYGNADELNLCDPRSFQYKFNYHQMSAMELSDNLK